MTNEEKAREIGQTILLDDCGWQRYDIAEFAALKMAEWKDQQFKEYLEKKKAEMKEKHNSYHSDIIKASNAWGIMTIDGIIDELFSKIENDNSENDE